jgi:hypothetical protein
MLIGKELKSGESPVSIGFVGFHELFHPVYNIFTSPLLKHFSFNVVAPGSYEAPDFLFFSVYGSSHRNPRYSKCVKIFTCEENIRVPWDECDYALTGDHLTNESGMRLSQWHVHKRKHLRLPIYVRFLYHLRELNGRTIIKPENFDPWGVLKRKTRFCNFVYSNGQAQERLRFLELLSKYKQVDSGGKVKNNLGYLVGDKLKFLESYKFTIAFENSSYPGYISEKLVEPMTANSIPIYWGCEKAGKDFNPSSFIIATGRRLEDVVEDVIRLDMNDEAYVDMLARPWFHNNRPNRYCGENYTLKFMKGIFSSR